MASKSRYAAIATKLRAMSAEFLTAADYQKLLALEDVEAVKKYLRQNTPYQLDFGADSTTMQSERALKETVHKRQAKILSFLLNEDLNFLKMLLRRSEIEVLKQIIRAIQSGKELNSIDFEAQSYYYIKDFVELLTADSLPALIKKLNKTPYAKVLEPYINKEDKKLLFYLESELDRYYFKELVNQIAKLNAEDKAILGEIIAVNIDLLNLQWIYRGKKYYDVQPEPLFNYLLAGGDRLKLSSLKELCYLDNADQLLKQMPAIYKHNFEMGDLLIELMMERSIDNLFRKKINKSSYNLSVVVAFLHWIEYEMRDIFTILEAKSYKIAADDIKKFLVHYEMS